VTIVELAEDLIRNSVGEDVVRLLKIYENLYPPDMGMALTEDNPGFMDLVLVGGDISVVGFWYGTSKESIADLALQDLVGRLLVPRGQSKLAPEFGNGPIDSHPRDGLPALVALAAAESPFVKRINSVRMGVGAPDEVILNIDAITPTGEFLGEALNIGG